MIRIILTMISTIGAVYCADQLDGQYLVSAGLVLSGFMLGALFILSIPSEGK